MIWSGKKAAMKKQTNLLEFEYYPEQNKVVIRAVHRPEFEYGHIGDLGVAPYITTTPDARVPLKTIELAMEFAQECRKQPRQFEGTPTAPPTKVQAYKLIRKGWVMLECFKDSENALVHAALRHTEDKALLALASILGVEGRMEIALNQFETRKVAEVLQHSLCHMSAKEAFEIANEAGV
jgi:hypothetical protein